MKTNHIDEKKKVLVLKREKLIGQFSDAVRSRKPTARVATEIRQTNDFLESLDQQGRGPASQI